MSYYKRNPRVRFYFQQISLAAYYTTLRNRGPNSAYPVMFYDGLMPHELLSGTGFFSTLEGDVIAIATVRHEDDYLINIYAPEVAHPRHRELPRRLSIQWA